MPFFGVRLNRQLPKNNTHCVVRRVTTFSPSDATYGMVLNVPPGDRLARILDYDEGGGVVVLLPGTIDGEQVDLLPGDVVVLNGDDGARRHDRVIVGK